MQNQKLRCMTSRGVRGMPSQVPKISWYRRDVVETVEQPGDPPDPALGQADLDLGEPHRDLRVQPVDRREHRPPEEQHADRVRGCTGRGCRRRRRRPRMQAQHGAGLLARRHERVPVTGVQRRQSESLGKLREGDRGEAPGRRSPVFPLRPRPDRAARGAGAG